MRGHDAITRVLAACVLTLAALPTGVAVVRADCAAVAFLPRIATVRGETFIGRLTSRDPAGEGSFRLEWDVESVIAGSLPATIVYSTEPCYGTRYEVGWRYLVSSGDVSDGSTTNTVAYLLRGSDSASLVVWWADKKAAMNRFGVQTVAEALDIVAPEALPDTSTARASDEPEVALFVGEIAVVGTLAVLILLFPWLDSSPDPAGGHASPPDSNTTTLVD